MNSVTINIAGDFMPSGLLFNHNERYCTEEVIQKFSDADFRIANLEAAIGTYKSNPTFDEEKMKRLQDIVWAIDDDLVKLTHFKIDAVSLANNHIFDLGAEGLKYTINKLDEMGILHFGAGINYEEARKPAVLQKGSTKIALIGFCDYRDETVGYVPFATSNKPGINPLYPLDQSCAYIRELKQKYDFVLVFPHWGIEHQWYATHDVLNDSRELINAGADAILGSHPHRIQTPFYYRNKPVFPSLGNFLFPDWIINKPRPTWYPTFNTEIQNYPRRELYPWVEEPTILVWKNDNRIGMVANLNISKGGIRKSNWLVYLDKNNILHYLKNIGDQLSIKYTAVLKITGFLYRFPLLYKLERYIHLNINRVRHFLKKK